MTQNTVKRPKGRRKNSGEISFPLVGPGGESVDLWRILYSHGMSSLPPMSLYEEAHTMEISVAIEGWRPRTIRISEGQRGFGTIQIVGKSLGQRAQQALMAKIRHILRLDEDLSGFYSIVSEDPDLAWVTSGAGRMIRSASVFEDVIKTICTTNCAWSATQRMVGALCAHLGERAVGAPNEGVRGRAFPTPHAMAVVDEAFYRDVARAGYRGRYLLEISRAVHEGSLDLEALGRASPDEITDDDLEERLLALPGVGPYAAAHIMFTMGRYSRLILDSWTRPKYARLVGRASVKDTTIQKRFRRYGRYAGLAFWMFLTRDWVDE
ncbi:MAG: Fe-S cluster assembly protein HesB [Anaerolineales bacterium]|nr:Fe-S cluster assembly protein HesB [Anaerolineales bacterium]